MHNSFSLLYKMYKPWYKFIFVIFVFTLAVSMGQATVVQAAVNAQGVTINEPLSNLTDAEFANDGTIKIDKNSALYGMEAGLPAVAGSPAMGTGFDITKNTQSSYTITNSDIGEIILHDIDKKDGITASDRTHSVAMGAYSESAAHVMQNDGEISFKNILWNDGGTNIISYGMYSETNGTNYLRNTDTISMELSNLSSSQSTGFVGMFAGKNDKTSSAGKVTLLNSGTILSRDGFYAVNSTVGGMQVEGASALEIENRGIINLQNEGGTGVIFGMSAVDLEGGGSVHLLTNTSSGEITLSSAGGSSAMTAYGMRAKGEGNHRLINEGDISIEASADAYGLSATGAGTHTIVNDGMISISNDKSKIYALYAQDSGDYGHTLANNKKIELTMTGIGAVSAMRAEGDGAHEVQNTGDIKITSSANGIGNDFYALYAKGKGNHTLESSGEIEISFEGVAGGNTVYALYAEGDGSHTLLNEDKIVITGAGDNAGGLYANSSIGSGSHYIKNIGSISVTGASNLYGLRVEGDFNKSGEVGHNIENLADITIEASGANVYGISVAGEGTHTISNSAKINVEGSSNVYAIHIGPDADGTTVSNTGEITAKNTSVGSSYEVYGESDYKVKNWSTVLRIARTGASNYVFGAANGKKIHFDGGTIIARAGEDFENGKVYDVRDMIDEDVRDDNISGGFGSVVTEVDLLRAVLIGTDAKTQQIRLVTSVDEKTNPVGQLATFTVNNTIARMQGLGAALFKQTIGFTGAHAEYTKEVLERQQAEELAATEGFEAEEGGVYGVSAGSEEAAASAARLKNWRTFISPYGAYATHSKYNGTGTSGGILGGLTYAFNDVFALGFHFDLNIASNELDAFEMTTDTFSGAFGLHGTVLFTPDWYARAQATVSFGSNDSTFSLAEGTGLSDDVNYGDFAFFAGLHTGYVYKINDNHTLTPEIGLTFLTMSIDDMSLRFKGAADYTGIYDIDFEEINYSALYGNFNLRYAGKFLLSDDPSDEGKNAEQNGENAERVNDKLAEEADKLYLSPSLAFGIRQNLTGTEMNSKLRFIGNTYTTKSYEDSTTFTANVGLELFNRTFSFGLAYDGEYGYYRKSHGGSALFKFNF